jgi:hypothetical protein
MGKRGAEKYFGRGWETKEVKVAITNLSYTRATKTPRSEIEVKSINKRFKEYDIDCLLKYHEDVLLKYHALWAECIKKVANTAAKSAADLDAEGSEEAKTADPEGENHNKTANKKGGRPRTVVSSNEDGLVDSDCEDLEFEEQEVEGSGDEGEPERMITATLVTILTAKPGKNADHVHGDTSFTGEAKVNHSLPSDATPFDYFCLYVPIYLFARWAVWTNVKAAMDGGGTVLVPHL